MRLTFEGEKDDGGRKFWHGGVVVKNSGWKNKNRENIRKCEVLFI